MAFGQSYFPLSAKGKSLAEQEAMRVGIWIRVSTEDQAKGESPVKLFEALFFNVRGRGNGFHASVLFPETRIGAVVEAEKDFDDPERTLMRVGRERGWKDVARLAGLRPMEDEGESSEMMLADMERTIAANARMLSPGHLNRMESPGIHHG